MGMTDEERFRFDLAGFFVRPAILTQDEVSEIVDQIDRIKHNPESLPPEHRAVPGGAASVLIDHPKVIEVLHEIIGGGIRLESVGCIWRKKGEAAGCFHGGRCFVAGSHKVNFPMHPDHTSWELGKRSDFFATYECPAGSALFFTENVCHAGPEWRRDRPRVAVLQAYSHLATHWHRLQIPPEVLAGLPREKQAYFREPWQADFLTQHAKKNTIERFLETGEPPINTEWVTRARRKG